GARPFAEQDGVADLEVDRDELAALVAAAVAGGDDLALRRLFLRGVGNDDAGFGLIVGIDAAHDNAIVQGAKLGLGHGLLIGACARVYVSKQVFRRSPRTLS